MLFVKNLFHSSKTSLKWDISILLLYAIGIIILFFIPGGIRINESTQWLPLYNWIFSSLLYVLFTLFITIPFSYYAIKILINFKEKSLRKKYKYFIIGSIGLFMALYGLVLYNTWQASIFRTIWSFIVFLIVIPSALLIYYGIGKDL
ncbi:MAG: hypothetical protein EU549_02135 [Promethearchaeota archaeon]|nr:MAG: hypothetical protein EU549_02135 [Candidatus Lokiarchaeota archaeon]